MNKRRLLCATAWSLRPVAARLAVVSVLMVARLAWAQPAPAPVSAATPITLQQAIEHGRSNRLSVRIAQAEVNAARARMNQARAQRWPRVDLSANVSDINNYDTFSGVTASAILPGATTPTTVSVTQDVPRYQASSGLKLRYDIYTGGRIQAQMGRQEQALRAAEVKHRMALRDVALEVAQAYFKLRRGCIKRDVAQRRANHALKALKRVQQRFNNGRVAAIETSEAELVLTEKQLALRTSQQDLEIAQTDFNASQNDQGVPVTHANTPSCHFAGSISSELAWIKIVADTSLEARYDRLQVSAAQEAVKVERAAARPQLNLAAEYTGIGRSENTHSGAFNDFRRRQAFVGLNFSFNLFDGGLAKNRVAEAQAEVNRLNLIAERDASQRQQTRARGELNVRMAENRIQMARARLELAQKQSVIAAQRQDSGSGSTAAVEEHAERLRDEQDEYRLAELDLALTRIAMLLPGSRISPGTAEVLNLNEVKENSDHE
ncbi:MAG: TolC family protein [Burkholderiaceae bacterium]|jgi:OMF family outer membrane factor|nr:TolC family protein [Burkholderiaceae bacterium]